jgi:hypothetical protein
MNFVSAAHSQQLRDLAHGPAQLTVKTLLAGNLPYYGIGVADDVELDDSETQDSYERLVASGQWLGTGQFVMHAVPDQLNTDLIRALPDTIKQRFPEPYIRLQTLENFQIPPHQDARTITVIVPLTDSQIETVFYDYIQPHRLFRNVTADPDLIHEVHRNRFEKHQAWLLNTKAVHATQGIESRPRVTVNFNWSGISYDEFLTTLAQ